jgi:type IV pilus assembly protein PilE
VVAIVAILAAIAYPSYREHVIRGHRAEAKELLIQGANRQQQFLLDARRYATTLAEIGLTATAGRIPYTLSLATNNGATPPTFTLTATAVGGQASDGNLSVNEQDNRLPADKW